MARYEAEFTIHRLSIPDPTLLPQAVAQSVEAMIAAGATPRILIDALPRLKLIANTHAGTEKIDIDAANARNIVVTNVPDAAAGCVADMAFGLMLAAGRRILQGDLFVRSGTWLTRDFPLVHRIHGKRLGILGLGAIGLAIARRAVGFDMTISYHNRSCRADVDFIYQPSVAALAEASDILVIACPGGPATRHLVDLEILEKLGPEGIVVNISRGTVLDEEALIIALTQGIIAGAGLDVLENEPGVSPALAALENVVLMPHRGGGTFYAYREACEMVIGKLKAYYEARFGP